MDDFRILIGYDGSRASRWILDDTRRAGLPPRAAARVVTYTEHWVAAEEEDAFAASESATTAERPAMTRGMLSLEHARDLSNEFAGELRMAFPEWTVTAEAHANAPEHGLVDIARDTSAHLLIVGTHGRAAVMRALLGSVSQKVLANAMCPVRVARAPHAGVGALRVLVATDGSTLANAAVDIVASRRWPPGSAAKVVAVDELFDASIVSGVAMPLGVGVPMTPGASVLRDVVDRAAAILEGSGLEVEARVLEGAVTETILDEAHRWGADSIFLGAQGHALIERMTLGSISAAIAARATCSVEVVR